MAVLACCMSAACDIPGPVLSRGQQRASASYRTLKGHRGWHRCGNPPQWTGRLFRPERGWTRAVSHRSCKQLAGTSGQKPRWAELLLHQLEKEMAGKLKTLYVILLTKTRRTHTSKQKQHEVYEKSSRLLYSKLFSLVNSARTSGNRDKLQRGSFGLNIKGWLIIQTFSC